jgi:hypothetical protein
MRKHVLNTVNLVKGAYPDRFRYEATKDAGTTGRFEVALWLPELEPVLLHSRKRTG